MRSSRLGFAPHAAAASILAAGLVASTPALAQRAGSDSVELAGRTVRCERVRILTDRRLPSEGAAAPGVLILNPRMLNEQPPTVRLFVFHHECGHHVVGDSELEADCWAVERGVREGWLDRNGLGQVCDSFEDAPETASHPSGRRRCRNLDRCFASTVANLQARGPAAASVQSSPRAQPASASPRLVSGPTLIGTGRHAYTNPAPCGEAAKARPRDGIGRLIARDAARSDGCN